VGPSAEEIAGAALLALACQNAVIVVATKAENDQARVQAGFCMGTGYLDNGERSCSIQSH
jgi:hypothetical protein